MGILVCTLLLSSKMVGAEESKEHLKNISKAVSAQLLRLKQKKMNAKSEVPISTNKVSADGEEKNSETKKNPSLPIKEKASQIPPKLAPDKSVNQPEKEGKNLQKDGKIKKKSPELKPKKASQTNLQKNDLLRQQIQNIVNTESK